MALALYMHHHVEVAISNGLRERGIAVLMPEQDDTKEFEDAELLDRATLLERIFFSRDVDLLAEAAIRQRDGIEFYGVVYAQQIDVPIGVCIHDLELVCVACAPKDVINQVFYLPL